MMTMEQELAVKRLAELGHDIRMSIYRLLVQAGHQGLPVGAIQAALDVTAPNLSHHLRRMMGAGLVRQERDGRVLTCFAELDALRDVVAFLDAECCSLEQQDRQQAC